ncbi:MAG: hypothetical protein ABIR46_04780 [Candidatus Saccharimonadales bacterium]
MARRKQFVPSRDQINCAKVRIQGYLKRHHGKVQMGSENDIRTLHGNISQPRDLGCKLDDQIITLRVALEELKKEELVAWDPNAHMMRVTYSFTPASRKERRYPVRASFRTA